MVPRARAFVAIWDEMLLRSRTMMLGAYFSVQPAGRFSESVRIVRDNTFDLLVLCHTLTDDEQECISALARQTYKPVRVLVLQPHAEIDKPFADHVQNSSRGPWELVRQCAEIVGYRLKTKAHRATEARSPSALRSSVSRK
jgi:hypothetical protein